MKKVRWRKQRQIQQMSRQVLVDLQAADKRRNLKFHITGELLEDLELFSSQICFTWLHKRLLCCCVIYLRTLESAFLSEFV